MGFFDIFLTVTSCLILLFLSALTSEMTYGSLSDLKEEVLCSAFDKKPYLSLLPKGRYRLVATPPNVAITNVAQKREKGRGVDDGNEAKNSKLLDE